MKHAASVDTYDLSAKKDFTTLKAEVGKQCNDKLVDVPTSLKTKKDNLDVASNCSIDLKQLSDVVKNEVVKNTNFITMKMKVNKLDKKIPIVTCLIRINQYNTDKQNFDKKVRDVDKKIQHVTGLLTTTVLHTKIAKIKNKMPVASDLVKKQIMTLKY